MANKNAESSSQPPPHVQPNQQQQQQPPIANEQEQEPHVRLSIFGNSSRSRPDCCSSSSSNVAQCLFLF